MASENPLRKLATGKAYHESVSTPTPVAIQSQQPAQDDDWPEDYDWRDEAACKGRSSEFFPKSDSYKSLEHIGPARAICRTCPVLEECREWVLTCLPPTDLVGIFAGLSPRQVASEQARLGLVPKYLTIAQVWASFEAAARKRGRDLYEREWVDDDEIEGYDDDDEGFDPIDI